MEREERVIRQVTDERFQCSVLKVQVAFCKRSGPVAQLVRAPPCHGGGRGFESLLGRSFYYGKSANGILAQLGEHLPYKQGVTGSSPVGPIYFLCRCGSIGRAADL